MNPIRHALTITTDDGVAVVHPRTGELVASTADTNVLADLADALAERMNEIKDVREQVLAVLLHRMDQSARWSHTVTVQDNGTTLSYKIEGPSPTANEIGYEADKLRAGLLRLCRKGVIDVNAVDAAAGRVTPAPFTKVDKNGVNRLKKLGNPEVDAVIEAAKIVTPVASRKAKVKAL